MKSNTLIIFTNEDRLKTLGFSESCIAQFEMDLNDSYKNLSHIDHIDVWIVKDNSSFAGINPFKAIPKVNFNAESTYIVLHKTKQGDDLHSWRKEYPKAHIDKHSHEDEDGKFYKEILPKICKGELKIADLERFFQNELDKALNELCDIWRTIDFTDNKAMEELDAERVKKLNTLV